MSKPKFHSIKITNLAEQKEKFFTDRHYNPIFIYSEPIDQEVLTKYGLPENDLFELSKVIIQKFKTDFGSFNDIPEQEGRLLSQEEINTAIQIYSEKNGITDLVEPNYTEHMVARTAVSLLNQKRFHLKIRTPVSYRERSMEAVLDHEIGTHIFRMINELGQSWYDHESRSEFADHIATEEGLATLHMLMNYPVKLPVVQATYYYAEYLGQNLTFAETFAELEKIIDDPEFVWFLTARVKRGLTDTSLPGGFTKDIVYLKGIIDVAKWLNGHNYEVQNLYLGKIDLSDVDACLSLNPQIPRLPHFVRLPEYQDTIATIIKDNEFLAV